jgi:RNA polymerase-associated protein CTR9
MQLARQAYKEALGKGIWLDFSEGTRSAVSGVPNEENQLFSSLEEEGILIEVPAEKVTLLFNLARLHEQLHETGKATVLYQLILFKVHEYAEIYAFCALSRVQCIHTVPLSEFW